MNFKIFVVGFIIFSMLYGCVGNGLDNEKNKTSETAEQLEKFESMNELKLFLKSNTIERTVGYDGNEMQMVKMESAAPVEGSKDYSSTNIQVEGVDEADFVKTDGEYIYVLSGSKIYIVRAHPPANAMIVSEMEINGHSGEFFVNKNDLVVFTRGYKTSNLKDLCCSHWRTHTGIVHYDISDKKNPEIKKEVMLEGDYFDSRMIGRHVYAVVNKNIWYDDEGIRPPEIYVDKKNLSPEFPEIYYTNTIAYSYRYSTIVSLDLDGEEKPKRKIYLLGGTSQMYVSEDNIYLIHQKHMANIDSPILPRTINKIMPTVLESKNEETVIHRVSISNGSISYQATGSVPGHTLNQFSMDEYGSKFRIATTKGNVAMTSEASSSKNNVYVLDMNLKIVGKLEDLAPGEKIYSARFMGNRAYLVTFRKVDPLFVIDLNDPSDPKVLGKLKIPGYSDYLHPYDENHLIGIGKEAIPSEEGDFAWYQGVKLSLFDVSDVEKPKEIAKYDIGDRGTESYALHDHKAFLFSKEKNLLIIPVLLAEIDIEQYPQGVEPWQSGDYIFQGVYVFDLMVDKGFDLRGRISHVDDEGQYKKSGHYFESVNSVKRSLYIEDIIYTVSDSRIKINEMHDLRELNEVDLIKQTEKYPIYYE